MGALPSRLANIDRPFLAYQALVTAPVRNHFLASRIATMWIRDSEVRPGRRCASTASAGPHPTARVPPADSTVETITHVAEGPGEPTWRVTRQLHGSGGNRCSDQRASARSHAGSTTGTTCVTTTAFDAVAGRWFVRSDRSGFPSEVVQPPRNKEGPRRQPRDGDQSAECGNDRSAIAEPDHGRGGRRHHEHHDKGQDQRADLGRLLIRTWTGPGQAEPGEEGDSRKSRHRAEPQRHDGDDHRCGMLPALRLRAGRRHARTVVLPIDQNSGMWRGFADGRASALRSRVPRSQLCYEIKERGIAGRTSMTDAELEKAHAR
jgi:hypothetical protein